MTHIIFVDVSDVSNNGNNITAMMLENSTFDSKKVVIKLSDTAPYKLTTIIK